MMAGVVGMPTTSRDQFRRVSCNTKITVNILPTRIF